MAKCQAAGAKGGARDPQAVAAHSNPGRFRLRGSRQRAGNAQGGCGELRGEEHRTRARSPEHSPGYRGERDAVGLTGRTNVLTVPARQKTPDKKASRRSRKPQAAGGTEPSESQLSL